MPTNQTAGRPSADSWALPAPAGKASDFIEPFLIRPGDRVYLLVRVSSRQQGKRGNAKAQEIKLREAVERAGGVVVGVTAHEWSGYGVDWLAKLREAATKAKGQSAILLAACTNRFIRSTDYRSTNAIQARAQATEEQLEAVHAATAGCRLMTYLDPDAPPEDCTSLLTRWGQEVKGRRGGRPPTAPGAKTRQRRELMPRALQLHGKMSLGDIAKLLGVKKARVQKWCDGTVRPPV